MTSRRLTLTAISLTAALAVCLTATAQTLVETDLLPPDTIRYLDMERQFFVIGGDTVHLQFTQTDTPRHGPLTEQDFIEVARELGVEVAAIKAVVDIEAGRAHRGFWTEGRPILNFDMTIYRQMARRHNINLSRYTRSHPAVFARPNTARYGSQQAAVQARFDQAATIDSVSAIEGTFWGMFQIGGFNWRLCGASSPQEFLRLMSRSERDQLELFGEFITRSGLLPALRAKNWSAFARGYNGPSYASRGYHRRLAEAYRRHK